MAACYSLCPLHRWCDQYRAQVPQRADEIRVGTLISRRARWPQGIESSVIMAGWGTAWRTMAGIECIKRLKMQMWIHSIFLGRQPCGQRSRWWWWGFYDDKGVELHVQEVTLIHQREGKSSVIVNLGNLISYSASQWIILNSLIYV